MNIYEYLCREARSITNFSLKTIDNKYKWMRERPKRWRQFIDMLGITEYIDMKDRPSLNVTITGVLDRERYVVEKLYFESLPKLYVAGNLYIPKNYSRPMPAILYLCGHARNQKYHYQAHPQRFAELGFVTLLIETIQWGEIPGYHHGTYRYGLFNWYSLGYTPTGVEVWNAIRAIDLLQSRPEVDGNRIGVTGISGGGAMTWYVSAVDDRVKACAPVCGTATIESHVCKFTINGHCDCMFWINNYMWDLTDVGALIAPRPLLIASAKRDWIFDIKSVRKIYRKLKKLYDILDASENIKLIETPGPHSYHELSRKAVFSWFLKHLRNIDIPLNEVKDIDLEHRESIDSLKVFINGIPSDERTTTVHKWFIKKTSPPNIDSREKLIEYRRKLIETLYEKTFNAFPKEPCNLDMRIELEQEAGEWLGYLIGFTSEEGWRLHIHVTRHRNAKTPTPIVLALLNPGETFRHNSSPLKNLDKMFARAYIEVRGIGETSWGNELQWYLRRVSMLTGRTIASMRVYDTIRALEAISRLNWIDTSNIGLMGSGEMSVIALYTALLWKKLSTLILHNPPPTQNLPSNPDGTGPCIEMLNCLRYTDLPYIAGLLWPTQIVFLGPYPETYLWTEKLYLKLGLPGLIRHIKDISQL